MEWQTYDVIFAPALLARWSRTPFVFLSVIILLTCSRRPGAEHTNVQLPVTCACKIDPSGTATSGFCLCRSSTTYITQ